MILLNINVKIYFHSVNFICVVVVHQFSCCHITGLDFLFYGYYNNLFDNMFLSSLFYRKHTVIIVIISNNYIFLPMTPWTCWLRLNLRSSWWTTVKHAIRNKLGALVMKILFCLLSDMASEFFLRFFMCFVFYFTLRIFSNVSSKTKCNIGF